MSDRVPRRAEALTHEVQGSGETVLYDEAGDQLLVLNETGAAIWLLVDGERTVQDITEVVAGLLDVDRAEVATALDSFLNELSEKNLVHWQ